LSAKVTYSNPDAKEGNQTYTATMEIKNEAGDTIATITTDKSGFTAPIILAKCSQNLFSVISDYDSNKSLPIYISGNNDINNKTTGYFYFLSNSIKISYKNINQFNYAEVSLKSDNIAVNMTGTIENTTPQPIESLIYSVINSEELSIPFYRGYKTDDQTNKKQYKYTINRKDLTSYIINVDTDFTSGPFDNIFVDAQNTISFSDNIGSIGTTIKSLFSRFPTSKLTTNKLIMPITISSDKVAITRTSYSTGEEVKVIETKFLQDCELYTFVNGDKLRSLNLRSSGSILNNSKADDFYSLTYGRSNISVYYNNSDIGNPTDLTDAEWGTKISETSFTNAKKGFIINETGLNSNGFLTVTASNDTKIGSISYIVIAKPQICATQLDIDGAKNLPFTTNTDDYDATKLVTQYFPIVSSKIADYKPFYEYESNKINNVTFTSIDKEFADYNNLSKNNTDVVFVIVGSEITMQEVDKNEIPTKSGPDKDGIIFEGLISDLLIINSDNRYNNFISLDSNINNELNLSYTQQYNDLFHTVFDDSAKSPEYNIKMSVSGFFIKDNTLSPYTLVSSITKGIITNIYDMIKQTNNIVLLKYECENLDFTTIPTNKIRKHIKFSPNKVYKSIVNMPVAKFGEKYLQKFNDIRTSDMTIDSSGNIVWTEIVSPKTILDNFSLSITAATDDGLHSIIEILYATSDIPVNFTVLKLPNAMEILGTDGTPKFTITAFGKLLTSFINTNVITLFDVIQSSVDLIGTDANIYG
jgi:hypothetical protein